MKNLLTKRNIVRVLIYAGALFVLGFGISMIIAGSFGLAPTETLMASVAKLIYGPNRIDATLGGFSGIGSGGISLATFPFLDFISIFTFVFGLIVTVISYLITKNKKLFLNIIAIFLVSLSIALGKIIWTAILKGTVDPASAGNFPTNGYWIQRVLVVLGGIVLLSFGASTLILTKLPVSPIDSFVMIMSEKTGKRVAIVKMVFDFSLLIIGFLILITSWLVNKNTTGETFTGSVIGLSSPYINIFTIVNMFLVGPLMDVFLKVMGKVVKYDIPNEVISA